MLQRLFEESREHISKEVLKGIELFVKTRWTGLCTDWSKMGVRYFMSQNYCSCLEITPTFCVTGWRVEGLHGGVHNQQPYQIKLYTD